MFRGDHPEVSRALGSGLAVARELGQPRAGSEHLLLGLSLTSRRVSIVALARKEREHRAEHLALALAALDPGVGWLLRVSGVPRSALLADLAATFPPPERGRLLAADRRLGLRHRRSDLIRRYQRSTGRPVTNPAAVATLITG